MYGMRDILIHEYFGVDVDTAWHTAKKQLPQLQKQLIDIVYDKSSFDYL